MPDTITFDELIPSLSKRDDFETIKRAYEYAFNEHKGMKRLTGDDFITHPLEVTKILMELNVDDTTIIASLLHGSKTYEDLVEDFGEDIAKIVLSVSKINKLELPDNNESSVIYLRKILVGLAEDVRVLYIKLADRLHNMRTNWAINPQKQKQKAEETMSVLVPIAHRLGINSIKSELENLSLYYLKPDVYNDILEKLNETVDELNDCLEEMKESLIELLTDAGIKFEIKGRVKSVYSIYNKLSNGKEWNKIYDILALRIFVNEESECYQVIGLIHSRFRPMPKRFKDYIASPKENMYQSLHTTVIGPNGTPFEIQIRTWEMHRIAENGIAAHWKYKEGISGKTDMDSKLEWVRQLLDTQTNIIDTDDFFNTLKFDLFEEEVFVFTPQGKVISLPAKSTVIDFAFAIHSEVGYKMSGAKVNGKIVPNNYMVQNGEIVEILTANTHGPSRDWLKICRTSQAKNKINQWFKRERRDENIEHGKELIERELRRIGNTHEQLFKQEWIAILLRRYGFQSIDDLYASVGYGGLTAQKVVFRLRDEWTKLNKTLEAKKNRSSRTS